MIFLSCIVMMLSLYTHIIIMPFISIFIAHQLKNDFNQFYRYMYSTTFLIYMMMIYVFIRDQEYLYAFIGLPLATLFFLLLKREENRGVTI